MALCNLLPAGSGSVPAEGCGRSVLQVQETDKAQCPKTVQQLGLPDFVGEGLSTLSKGSANKRSRHESSRRSPANRLASGQLQPPLPQGLRPVKHARHRLLPVRQDKVGRRIQASNTKMIFSSLYMLDKTHNLIIFRWYLHSSS